MQFKDIEGQRVLINRLTQIVDSGRVSHAQLFLGDTASGSLAMALAYAQYLNCEHRCHYPDADPTRGLLADSCGECPSCRQYQQLAHPDLHLFFPNSSTSSVNHPQSLEFRAEFREFMEKTHQCGTLDDWYSFLGVENKQGIIRDADATEMMRALSLKCYQAKQKVVVIWMAEKMNLTVANKLLKELEEPTGETIFLLVAESSDLMLPTVLSRTQLVRVPPRGTEQSLSPELQRRFSELFVTWMRMLFKLNMAQLSAWVESISAMNREMQKQFLLFAQDSIRACYLAGVAGLPLDRDFGDAKFNQSFPAMVTARNVERLDASFNETLFAIGRNGHPKIAFMHLSFNISKCLKRR